MKFDQFFLYHRNNMKTGVCSGNSIYFWRVNKFINNLETLFLLLSEHPSGTPILWQICLSDLRSQPDSLCGSCILQQYKSENQSISSIHSGNGPWTYAFFVGIVYLLLPQNGQVVRINTGSQLFQVLDLLFIH